MPPKEKVESTEQVLQAVILADSFDERFQPITLETARVRLHPARNREEGVETPPPLTSKTRTDPCRCSLYL